MYILYPDVLNIVEMLIEYILSIRLNCCYLINQSEKPTISQAFLF
jgi:hypothetical protein